MCRNQIAASVGLCILLVTSASIATTVGEKVDATGRAASSVAGKTERAVKTGVKAAASGVERGARATGRVADKGAQKVGIPGAGASAARP